MDATGTLVCQPHAPRVVPYLKENLNWRIEAVRVFRLCLVAGLAILDTVSTLF